VGGGIPIQRSSVEIISSFVTSAEKEVIPSRGYVCCFLLTYYSRNF